MILLNDIKEYNALFMHDFLNSVKTTIESGKYILGDKVEELERSICRYLDVHHCIGVSSGTSALELVFENLELNETDEIIIQANAYIACAFGCLKSRAKIRIIDCEANGTFSISNLKKEINPSVKAVLVVHLYGDCCNMNELVDLCNEHNVKLIEDCAQSFGSSYSGRKLGSFGYASCHSFYPTKNLGAIGDAGAICTNDLDFINNLKYVRNLGSLKKYIHNVKGTNSRLDPLQCGFLLTKLQHLDDTILCKQKIAKIYSENITNFKHLKNDNLQVYHSYHLYVIIVENRDEFIDFMNINNIETIVHYPIPFYKSRAFTELNHMTFKNAEYLSKHIVSIPIYPTLTDQQVQTIILKVNSFNKQ